MAYYLPSLKLQFRYLMFVSFWNKLSINQKLAITAWLFLAVPIAFYVTIRFYPTFEAFYVSTLKWNLLGAKKYIGLRNYEKIFADEDINNYLYMSEFIKNMVGITQLNLMGQIDDSKPTQQWGVMVHGIQNICGKLGTVQESC